MKKLINEPKLDEVILLCRRGDNFAFSLSESNFISAKTYANNRLICSPGQSMSLIPLITCSNDRVFFLFSSILTDLRGFIPPRSTVINLIDGLEKTCCSSVSQDLDARGNCQNLCSFYRVELQGIDTNRMISKNV